MQLKRSLLALTVCVSFLLTFSSLYGQGCYITITHPTQDTTICEGDSVYLMSDGSCSFLMNNDFSNQTIGAGWSATAANPVFNNPCGPGPNGWHLWVGTTPSSSRTLETNSYDISVGGCRVDWWMRYGRVQSYGNCEDPDAQNEGVHLQYSIDNGATWTDFPGVNQRPVGINSTTGPFTNVTNTPGSGGYWEPVGSQSLQSNNTNYFWHEYSSTVPAAAITNNTRFRWAQLATSNSGYDAWGIDEVQIVCNNFGQIVAWSHGANVFNPVQPVSPTTTTSYIVMIMDFFGNIATDTVTIYVTPKVEPDLGADTTICNIPGNMITLDPGAGYDQYTWSTGATTPLLDVGTSGIYTVTTTVGNCSGADTIDLTLIPPPVANAGADQMVCFGDTAWLQAQAQTGLSYVWSTGDSTSATFVTPAATQQYTVTVSVDTSCYSTDSMVVVVNPLPDADAGPDEALCRGDSVFVNASGGQLYQWSTGDSLQGFWLKPLRTSDYSVTVTDAHGCIEDDTMQIVVHPLPEVEIVGGADTMCFGDSTILIAVGASDYVWSTGHTSDAIELKPRSTQNVVVTGTDANGCVDTESHFLYMEDCTTFYIPSAFTPGGKNPLFGPSGDFSGIESYEFLVYDRWGKMVFATKDMYELWDGKADGEMMPEGVYTYYISFTSVYGKSFTKGGTVTMIRYE